MLVRKKETGTTLSARWRFGRFDPFHALKLFKFNIMSKQDEKRALQVRIDNARKVELSKSIQFENGLIKYEEYKDAINLVDRLEIEMADLDSAIMLNED